jgi:hypothetical protein
MASIEDLRAEWLYGHFQAISAACNHYLAALLICFAFALAGAISTVTLFTVPILGLAVARNVALSFDIMAFGFLMVSFCGCYDKGEATLNLLAAEVGCEYEDLNAVDTHPNPIDFAQFVNQKAMAKRSLVSRFLALLLYPFLLIIGIASCSFIAAREVATGQLSIVPTLLYVAAATSLFFAWKRLLPYFGRRLRHFLASERGLSTAPFVFKHGDHMDEWEQAAPDVHPATQRQSRPVEATAASPVRWMVDVNQRYQKVVDLLISLSTAALVLPPLFLQQFLGVQTEPLALFMDKWAWGSLASFGLAILLGIAFHWLSAKWIKRAWGQPTVLSQRALERCLDITLVGACLAFVAGLSAFVVFATR